MNHYYYSRLMISRSCFHFILNVMRHIYWLYVEPPLHPGINPTWSWWLVSLMCCRVWVCQYFGCVSSMFFRRLICTFLTVPRLILIVGWWMPQKVVWKCSFLFLEFLALISLQTFVIILINHLNFICWNGYLLRSFSILFHSLYPLLVCSGILLTISVW